MKKVIISILIFSFTIFIFLYLMISFTAVDFDFRNWNEGQRLFVSFFSSVLILVVSGAIIIHTLEE